MLARHLEHCTADHDANALPSPCRTLAKCTLDFTVTLDKPGSSNYILTYSDVIALGSVTPAAIMATPPDALFSSTVSSGAVSLREAGLPSPVSMTLLQDAR